MLIIFSADILGMIIGNIGYFIIEPVMNPMVITARSLVMFVYFFTQLFVSERKQIALFRLKKLFKISRAVLRNELLRNGGIL